MGRRVWTRRVRAAVLLSLAILVSTAARLLFGRAVVDGNSMAPAFLPGDRILYGPAFSLRAGDVIVLADPRQSDRLIVKRVHQIPGDLVDVRGDNEFASTDGRHFGPVPLSLVRGRVFYRYAPRERAGWLRQ